MTRLVASAGFGASLMIRFRCDRFPFVPGVAPFGIGSSA